MNLRFLGTDAAVPRVGDDTASYLVDEQVLIDTGWYGATRLMSYGLTPLDLTHLVFTHLHHDHYVGLPQILFYRWMKRKDRPDAGPLTIVGPAEDLGLVVQLAKDFLQVERFGHRPELELRPLSPGDEYEIGGLRLTTCATRHPVAGLCYRFEELSSGAVTVFTGDTAFHPPIAEHARGADLLIHDATAGPKALRDEANQHGHSGAPDAAVIAAEAGVRRLALVHSLPDGRVAGLAAARAIFPDSFVPEPGELVEVTRGG